jgi:6-phosphogluconolactonase
MRAQLKRLALFFCATCSVAAPAVSAAPAAARGGDYIVYVGSYTTPGTGEIRNRPSSSEGIYAWRFNATSGNVTPIGPVADTVNPAYVYATPNGHFLYAVNWQTVNAPIGDTVTAYAINSKTGELTFLNRVNSGGGLPNEIVVDPRGKIAVVTNYGFHAPRPSAGAAPVAATDNNSSFAALPILPGGRLGDPFYVDHHVGGPSNPNGHSSVHGAIFTKDDRFVFVADLGLKRVYSYHVDVANLTITPSDPPYVSVGGTAGARRLALSPNGRFLYVNSEGGAIVSVYQVDGGNLKEIQQISTVPADFKGRNATAETLIDKSGHFLYVSNRGHDSLALYAIDPVNGTLTSIEYIPALGKSPRNMTFDPTGTYLFASNQDSDNVVIFKMNAKTGHLTPTGKQLQMSNPSSVYFVKAGEASADATERRSGAGGARVQ